jgi:hypothetical protein
VFREPRITEQLFDHGGIAVSQPPLDFGPAGPTRSPFALAEGLILLLSTPYAAGSWLSDGGPDE